MHIHFLTGGFVAPNTRSLLFPLIVHNRALRKTGITWENFTAPSERMFDCDILVVESSFHGKRWTTDRDKILTEMQLFASRVDRLFYLDTSDSTALLHPEVLPFVARYFKNQLLVNRNLYKDTHYGRRIFTDFSHRKYGILDDAPEDSVPVLQNDQLEKLGVWWNSSLADWSPAGRYRMKLYARLPFAPLLAFPKAYTDACDARQVDVSCRMGVNYDRETVSWHRKTVRERLAKWSPADRVSYREYVKEMQSSKIVVSPFGWGEINYKDYETFLTGGLLVKPDMAHLETWPALYIPNQTYCPYQWDVSNLVSVIEELLSAPQRACEMAAKGQKVDRDHIVGNVAAEKFCHHLKTLTSEA